MRRRNISAEESLRCSLGFRRAVSTLQRGLGVEKSLEDESPGRRRVAYKGAVVFLSFPSPRSLYGKNSTTSSPVFRPLGHLPLSAPCHCPLSSVRGPLSSTARHAAHHRPYSERCRCHRPVPGTPLPLSLGVPTTCALTHYKHSLIWPSTVQLLVNASSPSMA